MSLPPSSSILCEDLMVQILSWLPVKSLVRFKCVSKSLKSLISDPSFVKLHLHRSPKNVNLLLKLKDPFDNRFVLSCSMPHNSTSVIVEDIDDCQFHSQHSFDIIGSCNGMVCLVDESSSLQEYQVCLWNPATRLRSQRSSCLLVQSEEYYYFYTPVLGFGYDCLSDTYKLVAILFKHSYEDVILETEAKVYNIGDNCWKNIQRFPGAPYLEQDNGIYLRGTLSWFAASSSNQYYLDKFSIVSLDLGKETFKQFSIPHGLDEVIYHPGPSLGVLKDCLCFIHRHKGTHLGIWQMKEYGVENSWTQLFSFSYHNLQFDYLHDYPLKIGTFDNGGVLIMTTDDRLQGITYSQRDDEVERYKKVSNNILWINATDYIQSLVSPCRN